MKRPRRPRSSNLTWPVTSANSVSSLPCPTFSPAWCFVPRWRTRIVPALTSWPPKRLTPSLCPCESRPFVEEPPPVLCARTLSFSKKSTALKPSATGRLKLDVSDLNGRVVLPVTARNLVLTALLELEHGQLLGAALRDDLAADAGLSAVLTQQNLF